MRRPLRPRCAVRPWNHGSIAAARRWPQGGEATARFWCPCRCPLQVGPLLEDLAPQGLQTIMDRLRWVLGMLGVLGGQHGAGGGVNSAQGGLHGAQPSTAVVVAACGGVCVCRTARARAPRRARAEAACVASHGACPAAASVS